MKKLFYSIIVLTLSVTVLVASACSFNSGKPKKAERKASGTIEYIFTQYEGYSYEAPSIIKDGEDVYVSYTTNSIAKGGDKVIAVRKGTFTDGKFTFGAEKIAIRPTANGWDKYNVDNSDMVKGEFNYKGTEYTFLMFYQASSFAAEKRYQIGAAVSKDGLNWLKVGDSPIISYDYEVLGDTAGVCYPSLVNLNGKANLLLFFSKATSLVSETRFVEIQASNLDDLVMSGEISVPSKGLPLDGNEWGIVINADFAYDSASNMLYVVKDGFPYASNNAQKATKIEIAKIALSDMYKQNAEWTTVVNVLDGIELGGYSRIYSAEFVTNAFSGIDGANAELLFTSGVSAENATDETYKFKNGIHYYKLETGVSGENE